MTPLIPIAGAVVILALALGSKKTRSVRDASFSPKPYVAPSGPPYPWGVNQESHLNWMAGVLGERPSYNAIYRVRYGFNVGDKTDLILKNRNELSEASSEHLLPIWNFQRNEFAKRQAAAYAAGKDLHFLAGGPVFPTLVPYHPDAFSGKPEGWELRDLTVFGMAPEGESGFDALELLGTVGNMTLPYIPGYGQAANAALQATVALGKGRSLDEAALAAVRATLPPWAQVAFDLGVGVVLQKKPIDQAAVDAALNQLETKYPGARAAYEEGRSMGLGGLPQSTPQESDSPASDLYSRILGGGK